LLAAAAGSDPPARAEPSSVVSIAAGDPARPRTAELKRLQLEIMLGGAKAELRERRVKPNPAGRARSGKVRARPPAPVRADARAREPREREEAGRDPSRLQKPASLPPARAVTLPANRRINAGPGPDDLLGSTQSEVALAVHEGRMVAAWNDAGITDQGLQGIGYGWSTDGGQTWTDGGIPPLTGGVLAWLSDPVLTVSEKSGGFYLGGLVTAEGARNGLAVVRGTFSSSGFGWETPRLVRAVRDSLPDKPWIAADSSNGNIYIAYATFYASGNRFRDRIDFQRSTDDNGSWSLPVRLSGDDEEGRVQGARPAVGPSGELYVVWRSIDTTAAAGGLDYMKVRRSTDGGASFLPAVKAASIFANFGSGAPGFNRGNGLGFPGIAVDRSDGPHRGRIHAIWNESLNFFDDTLGAGAAIVEQEPNDQLLEGNQLALGDRLRGAIAAPGDVDRYRIQGLAGQTAVFFLDSLDQNLDVALRLLCADRTTDLAFSGPEVVKKRVIVFTFPISGEYYLTVAPVGSQTGGYRVLSAAAARGAERGRDHRDVFSAYSDDGIVWSEPTRVNDSPPGFDDWLPEIAVSGEGRTYAVWYDWRESPLAMCGGASHLYLARADDVADRWIPLGPVTTVQTAWSAVPANLSPNQGDYIALVADGTALHPAWADGRFGTPDVLTAAWPLALTPVQIALSHVEAGFDHVELTWEGAELATLAHVQRRKEGGPWNELAALVADAHGRLRLVDRDVVPGRRYAYRLRVRQAGGEIVLPEVWVEIPSAAPLAIRLARSNPSAREISVWVTIPPGPAAMLELIDLRGRRVASQRADPGASGPILLGGEARLAAGVYVVRLRQGSRAVSTKVTVMR
jgi:hypothetical protein